MRALVAGALVASALSLGGCAAALVNAESVLFRTITVTQDTADVICDAGAATPDACRAFNVRLVIILEDAKAFNRGVRSNSAGEVPAMLSALIGLRDEALLLFADEHIRESIRIRIEEAYRLIWALKD